jgi:predicted nucleic acid-binding protein
LVIYLDSSAVVKLIAPEPESPVLTAWLAERTEMELVTSKLAEVEVPRALCRNRPAVLGAAAMVLTRLYRVEVNDPVRATAAAYLDPYLRSLDAIHLATADQLAASGKAIAAFVTYDKRLAASAADAGHTVVAPGTSM